MAVHDELTLSSSSKRPSWRVSPRVNTQAVTLDDKTTSSKLLGIENRIWDALEGKECAKGIRIEVCLVLPKIGDIITRSGDDPVLRSCLMDIVEYAYPHQATIEVWVTGEKSINVTQELVCDALTATFSDECCVTADTTPPTPPS